MSRNHSTRCDHCDKRVFPVNTTLVRVGEKVERWCAACVDAARSLHTSPPVWEQAHRLRDALLDSFHDHEVRTMADLFALVMDDGVTQSWVRALTVTAEPEGEQ